ncbi:hypothetical protein [Burkholderia ubonensis]|uniref:hypothetical protein n=1 Tax=Burkholderia ubonensis TaxID=101571 RepID=UPI0008FE3933|nr:hypothetical protein [Burkholderia ubonensis]OJA84510.1 hypothetical protein BGV49_21650 [Burkholderia ubonensis]
MRTLSRYSIIAQRACIARVRFLASVLVVLVAASTCQLARAGAIAPCDQPVVFEGSAVNVLVLPYTAGVSFDEHVTTIGMRLSLLIQQDSLIRLAKYSSIAVVDLVPRRKGGFESPCNPETVLRVALGWTPGAPRHIQPGKGVVLVWGRIYQEKDDIYIQTFARFLRNGETETITATPPDAKSNTIRFIGNVPWQSFAFEPHRVTQTDLNNIEKTYEQLARIHTQASDSAPATPLLVDPAVPIAYQVLEIKGEWMRVKEFYFGKEGWLRSSGTNTKWPLLDRIPELNFIDGLVGYLQYKEALAGKGPQVSAKTAAMLGSDAFQRYERSAASSAPVARAASMSLRAVMMLDPQQAELSGPVELFNQSAALAPQSAEARNLQTMFRAARCCASSDPAKEEQAIVASFLGALSLDPGNRNLVANLESFYSLLASRPDRQHAFDTNELSKRLVQVRDVKAHLKQE